jgi:hypothetical protein
MRSSAQLARFKPVAPPATVGSLAAAKYMPKMRTFAGEISLAGRVPGEGTGPDVYRAVFRAPQSLAPGEYRLVVTITGASGSQTVTSRFTVAAAARASAGAGS